MSKAIGKAIGFVIGVCTVVVIMVFTAISIGAEIVKAIKQ